MTPNDSLASVFPITPTIFEDTGAFDDAGQRAMTEFLLRARVHGMVLLANASEGYAVLDSERPRVICSVFEMHLAGQGTAKELLAFGGMIRSAYVRGPIRSSWDERTMRSFRRLVEGTDLLALARPS